MAHGFCIAPRNSCIAPRNAALWMAAALAVGCGGAASPGTDPDARPTPDAVPPDATVGTIAVAVAPDALRLHVGDLREVTVTVVNEDDVVAAGPPTVALVDASALQAEQVSTTCTGPLLPHDRCEVRYVVEAVAEGVTEVTVEASADPGARATAALAVEASAACPSTCGPLAADNCCASARVPGNREGATFDGDFFVRGYDEAADLFNDRMAVAEISDFRLDTYEVTVGRFRQFVDAGFGTQAAAPADGAGAHDQIPGSGWNAAWTASLAPDSAALKAALKCVTAYQTWTDAPGANEFRPINCITWYEAMAFCAWDGGYLPTEAEWNYAAAGGAEQRAYPWSTPASSVVLDETRASYNQGGTAACRGDGVDGCSLGDVVRPGSKPLGNGRWGHADLAGNVAEYTLDGYADGYPRPCVDCLVTTGESNYWIARGGFFIDAPLALRTAERDLVTRTSRSAGYGVRCARTP